MVAKAMHAFAGPPLKSSDDSSGLNPQLEADFGWLPTALASKLPSTVLLDGASCKPFTRPALSLPGVLQCWRSLTYSTDSTSTILATDAAAAAATTPTPTTPTTPAPTPTTAAPTTATTPPPLPNQTL